MTQQYHTYLLFPNFYIIIALNLREAIARFFFKGTHLVVEGIVTIAFVVTVLPSNLIQSIKP